jgi:hypothetical protein
MVRRFFIDIFYKLNEAFCALKIEVISSSDKAVLYTIADAIFPVNALVATSTGSQAIKKLSPDKGACVTELEAVAIPLALQR